MNWYKYLKASLFIFLALSNVLSFGLVTGTVINDQGKAVPFALISKSSDYTKWVKADKKGVYSIDLNVGDFINIAAFKYETKKGIKITAASNFEIVLSEDALLKTDVLHIGFDNFRPGKSYPEVELREDLSVFYGGGLLNTDNSSVDNGTIDLNESIDVGGRSLKILYPKDKLGTGESGVDIKMQLAGTSLNNNDFEADELYLSYWVKFSDNYEFDKCGGKLPSLGGSLAGTRDEEWKGRIMWRMGGSIQFYMELPHGFDGIDNIDDRYLTDPIPGSIGCDFDDNGVVGSQKAYKPLFKAGQWHNVEIHYVLDDGVKGGLFEVWIDGAETGSFGHKALDSKEFGFYRRKDYKNGILKDLTINQLKISSFYGGSYLKSGKRGGFEPDKDTYTWFDEFRVSRNRINEYSKYRLVTSTNESTDIRINQATSVFPNPSNNGVFELSKNESWNVFNALGENVANGNSQVVNLSNERSGIYYLVLEGGTHKIVIN